MSAEAATSVVVDASLAIKWLLPEPDSTSALALRRRWDNHGIAPAAPDFLLIEVHNVLWKKLTRGDITPDAPILSAAPTFGLDLNWFPAAPLLAGAWELAVRCQVSIYDALYGSLAQYLRAPLYTADEALARRLKPLITVHTLTTRSPHRS